MAELWPGEHERAVVLLQRADGTTVRRFVFDSATLAEIRVDDRGSTRLTLDGHLVEDGGGDRE